MLGSNLLNPPSKSILKPDANGINPSIVVMAVNSTGRNLVFPAFTIQSFESLSERFASESIPSSFFFLIFKR